MEFEDFKEITEFDVEVVRAVYRDRARHGGCSCSMSRCVRCPIIRLCLFGDPEESAKQFLIMCNKNRHRIGGGK